MLVLTRCEGDSVFIGKDIVVTVLSITNNQVRIGIEAPKEINIVREEVLLKERYHGLLQKPKNI